MHHNEPRQGQNMLITNKVQRRIFSDAKSAKFSAPLTHNDIVYMTLVSGLYIYHE